MESRSNRIAVFSAILISIISSCNGEKETATPFSVSAEAIETEAAEARITITVSSPSPWTAESAGSWCGIIPPSGGPTSSIGTSVTLVVDKNEGTERSCDVTIVSESGEKASIRVFQDHDTDGIVLEKDSYKIDGETTLLDIPFYCGVPITAAPQESWMEVTSSNSNSISLRIGKYQSFYNRTGILRLTSADGRRRDIRITQGDGFSDPVLYEYILNRYDLNGDGILSKNELARITSLTLRLTDDELPIKVLDGFECMSGLKSLKIHDFNYAHEFPLILRINGHPSITTLEFGDDWSSDSGISYMEVTDCPELQIVDFDSGRKLEKAVFISNPSLQELTLNNEFYGYDCSTLKDLVLEGCEGLRKIMIGNAHFEREQKWGPLPQLRTFEMRDFDGTQCLDFSKSLYLESVNLNSGVGSLKYILIPKNLKTDFKTDASSEISIIYK